MEIISTDIIRPSFISARYNLASRVLAPKVDSSSAVRGVNKTQNVDAPTPIADIRADHLPDAIVQRAAKNIGRSYAVAAEAEASLERTNAESETAELQKAEEQDIIYREQIERAEQALREAAIFADKAWRRQTLLEIDRDSFDEADARTRSIMDRAIAIEHASGIQTKETYRAAKEALNSESPLKAAPVKGYYTIMI